MLLAIIMLATTPGFTIDTFGPAEGVESDCAAVYWRAEAKPAAQGKSIPNIFQRIDDNALIKIDGQVHKLASSPRARLVFTDAMVTAELRVKIVKRHDTKDNTDMSEAGTLKVTYRGVVQALAVKGEDFCYSGD